MVTVPAAGPCSVTASHRRLGLTARHVVPRLSAASVMKRWTGHSVTLKSRSALL
jgi:hypothetical protein